MKKNLPETNQMKLIFQNPVIINTYDEYDAVIVITENSGVIKITLGLQ